MDKIWLDHYPAGIPATVSNDDTTLVDMLDDVCKKYPHSKAVSCHGVAYDYAQTLNSINNLAASLARLGVRHGGIAALLHLRLERLRLD